MDSSTRELITTAQASTALAVVSLAALFMVIVFAVLGWKNPSQALFRAALLSCAGVAVYPLWLLYNSIEDRLGLDSVAGLLINLALFAAVGVGAGLFYRRISETRHGDAETANGTETADGRG